LFELADGGTIFLDEVGDMPLGLQAKLLRFLEERMFRRVGGTVEISVDVRVIAASNRDIEKAMEEGKFRNDLMFRLNVIPIYLPPLRARGEDVRLLTQHFVDQFAQEFRKPIHRIEDQAYTKLAGYSWPGNVRELRNVLERAVLLCKGDGIGAEDVVVGRVDSAGAGLDLGGPTLPTGGLDLRELESKLIREAMARTNNNQTQAAKLLKLSRDALRSRLEKLNML
jgi:transcriptional regulator with PAS, ATPase and Fis domain